MKFLRRASKYIALHLLLYLYIGKAIENPEEFPNLLAGSFTDGSKFSTGNTLPLVGYPWGFNHWAPMTRDDGRFTGSWWFNGNEHTLRWLRCTHQPSPWIGDYGWFVFGPQLGGMINRNPDHFWEPRGSIIKPYVFDATVATTNMRIELTPSMHGAMLRVTFPSTTVFGDKRICFASASFSSHGMSPTPYFEGESTQINTDRSVVLNFALHLRAESISAQSIESHNDVMCFKYRTDATIVIVRIGTSLISKEQAKLNLDREIGDSKGYDDVYKEVKGVWNQ
jgi:putative alpha-1,2-mannosidase